MSHFSVLVPARDEFLPPINIEGVKEEKTLAEVLQPWHEYECTGIKDKYVVWVDIHDENLDRFNSETIEVVTRSPNLLLRVGTSEIEGLASAKVDVLIKLLKDNPKKFEKVISKYGGKSASIKRMITSLAAMLDSLKESKDQVIGSKYSRIPEIQAMWHRETPGFSDEFVLRQGYKLIEMPFSEYYDDFDHYMIDWCGYEDKHPDTGRFGQWTNPDAKWDWWTIGGRWTGMLLPGYNPCEDPSNQEECRLCSGTGNRPDTDTTGCNGCNGAGKRLKWPTKFADKSNYSYAGAITWDAIADEWRNNQRKWLSKRIKYIELAKDNPADPEDKEFWEQVERRWGFGEFAHAFGNYENCVSYTIARSLSDDSWFDDVDDIATIFLSDTDFEEALLSPPAQTFAFIDTKGNWHQKGEMGWWGVSDKGKGTDNYDGAWWQFVKSLPDNQFVYVVDCHI